LSIRKILCLYIYTNTRKNSWRN